MSGPKGWRIDIGDGPSSLLAEVLNCHQVWKWLSKAQRATLLGADKSGWVSGRTVVLRHLREHGLTDDEDVLTTAGRLVLGWNDEESGPWRERLMELRGTLSSTDQMVEIP